MSNYVKVNGAYLKEYTPVVGADGRDYLVDLRFSKNVEDAIDVPNNLISRMVMSIRKSLRLSNDVANYLYEITSIDGKADLGKKEPSSMPSVKTPPSNYGVARPYVAPKVDIDLVWLVDYMLTKGISNIQLAKDMGYTDDKIYYGTKIVKGLIKVTFDDIQIFARKHPAVKKHYTIVSKTCIDK